jgi:hypothetical protein
MQVATIPRDLPRKGVNPSHDAKQLEKSSQFVKLMQIYFRVSGRPNEDTGEVCRLTLVFSSNRPFGVRSMMLGGRNGYSAGSRIRK